MQEELDRVLTTPLPHCLLAKMVAYANRTTATDIWKRRLETRWKGRRNGHVLALTFNSQKAMETITLFTYSYTLTLKHRLNDLFRL